MKRLALLATGIFLAPARPGRGLLRLLRRRGRRRAVQQRHPGGAHARRHPHGSVHGQQLPGPARRTLPWWCRCRWCCRKKTSRPCRQAIFQRVDAAHLAAPGRVLGAKSLPHAPARLPEGRCMVASYARPSIRRRRDPALEEGRKRTPKVRCRGQVRGRRVPDRDLSADDSTGPLRLAQRQAQIQYSQRGRKSAAAVYRQRYEVLSWPRSISKKSSVDPEGRTMLSPCAFTTTAIPSALPIRLGLLNSKGTQDLIVHILARGQRYEVANYKNVTIPTNIYITGQDQAALWRVLRLALRRTMRAEPPRRGHRILLGRGQVRSRARDPTPRSSPMRSRLWAAM